MSPYVGLKSPHVCFRIRVHCFGFISGGGSYLVPPPVLPVGAAWFIVVSSSLAYRCLFIVGVPSVYDWFDFGLLWFIIGSSLVVRININHRWYRVDTSMLLAEPVKMAHH